MKILKRKEGFTLVELLVVMAIIAVIAVLAIAAIVVARRGATETANRASSRSLQACYEAYASRFGGLYCGVAGTTNTCAVGTVDAKRGQINADLGAGSCNATPGTAATPAGGGNVTAVTNQGYTIVARNWNNTADLETFANQ